MRSILAIVVASIVGCSTIDLAPAWRTKGYRCQNVDSCVTRIKRVVTGSFQRNCKAENEIFEVRLSIFLDDAGFIESHKYLNGGNIVLGDCALKTLETLQPFFELIDFMDTEILEDRELEFSFVSESKSEPK